MTPKLAVLTRVPSFMSLRFAIPFLAALMLLAGCGGSSDGAGTSPAPATGAGTGSETTTGTGAETGTGAGPGTETGAITACGVYSYEPVGCQGSPENPSCVDEIRLEPDGTGTKMFDDILARATWTLDGDQLTVRAPEYDYEATFTLAEGSAALVTDTGARYEREDCQ